MHFIFTKITIQSNVKRKRKNCDFPQRDEKSPLYTVDGHENKRLLALCIMQICARLLLLFLKHIIYSQ